MAEGRRWVRRSATKVPLTTTGMAASATDPATWSTYAEAEASTVGVGMGFVLSDVDRIACVDVDRCIAADGTLTPWAEQIVRAAGTTFVEVSPSGTGLHIFGYANIRQGRRIRKADGYAVEIYSTGRYIATTGQRFRGAPATLADISELVASLT
jgi:primase-polymerase (primpol)-like protein